MLYIMNWIFPLDAVNSYQSYRRKKGTRKAVMLLSGNDGYIVGYNYIELNPPGKYEFDFELSPRERYRFVKVLFPRHKDNTAKGGRLIAYYWITPNVKEGKFHYRLITLLRDTGMHDRGIIVDLLYYPLPSIDWRVVKNFYCKVTEVESNVVSGTCSVFRELTYDSKYFRARITPNCSPKTDFDKDLSKALGYPVTVDKLEFGKDPYPIHRASINY